MGCPFEPMLCNGNATFFAYSSWCHNEASADPRADSHAFSKEAYAFGSASVRSNDTISASSFAPYPTAAAEMYEKSFQAPEPDVCLSSTSTSVGSSDDEEVGGEGRVDGSVDSALHSAGKCNPCAWFWKPNGCQLGASCNFCHLCGKGELGARKKAKIAAMRAGTMEPLSKQRT